MTEHDWQRVVDQIEQRTAVPNLDLYQAAYDHLASRSEGQSMTKGAVPW